MTERPDTPIFMKVPSKELIKLTQTIIDPRQITFKGLLLLKLQETFWYYQLVKMSEKQKQAVGLNIHTTKDHLISPMILRQLSIYSKIPNLDRLLIRKDTGEVFRILTKSN